MKEDKFKGFVGVLEQAKTTRKTLEQQSMILYNVVRAFENEGKVVFPSGILAGTIRVEPEFIPLGHCNYEVDARPVVIQRMRVIKARAKIPEWEISFQIVYNKRILTGEIVKTLETILDDAGTRMGLLDYRPQHKGWFGTFEVAKFEIVD